MLDILISGARKAGLIASIALQHAGHRMRVYESSSSSSYSSNEVGAAINVPPNAARLLLARGLDLGKERFVVAQSILVGVGATLETLSLSPVGNG